MNDVTKKNGTLFMKIRERKQKNGVVTYLNAFYSISTTFAVHILQYFAKLCILCTEITDTYRKINTVQNAANGGRTAHFGRRLRLD